MKGKDRKVQAAQAAQVQTQGVAQPDMEELTQEELEQISGGEFYGDGKHDSGRIATGN